MSRVYFFTGENFSLSMSVVAIVFNQVTLFFLISTYVRVKDFFAPILIHEEESFLFSFFFGLSFYINVSTYLFPYCYFIFHQFYFSQFVYF